MRTRVHKQTCAHVFVAALLTIAPPGNNANVHLLTSTHTNVAYYTGKYYAAIKTNEIHET
jgi:hypothetical protein